MMPRFVLAPLFVGSLCVGAAHAADRSVLVPPVEARTRAASDAAATLTGQIEAAVARRGLPTASLDRLPKVGDLSARAYAESCPPGQGVGCAFVLGGGGEVGFAVSVGLATAGDALRAEVHVLAISRAEDALAFEGTFAPGDEAVFADAVAEVVLAVVQGRAGVGGDIRQKEDPLIEQEERRQKAVAGKQLDSLSKEIGGADDVGDFTRGTITREKVTAEQLAEASVGEGVKPWERLGMTMGEYLRYRNSGLSLASWRKRMMGRAGQVLVRPGLGYGRGPQSFEYNFQGHEDETFAPVESWAYQSTVQGSGLAWSVGIAYGITSIVEVGAFAGQSLGRYTARITETRDGMSEAQLGQVAEPLDDGAGSWVFGPQVMVAPLQALPVRPVIGGALAFYRGSQLSDHFSIPRSDPADAMPEFPRPLAVVVQAIPGVEGRLADNLDGFLHVPVGVLIGGTTEAQRASGTPGTIERIPQPTAGTVSAGLLAGVQIRFGGRSPAGAEDPDFEPRD